MVVSSNIHIKLVIWSSRWLPFLPLLPPDNFTNSDLMFVVNCRGFGASFHTLGWKPRFCPPSLRFDFDMDVSENKGYPKMDGL